ncbi:MAG: hypothetical protein FJ194_19280 [Gammaproteobacteria bacterium]|nr:hypothetical protein [Gammaproteobacteria bacterium]
MTPEVVVYRYLEAVQREPVDVAALTRIICADADFFGIWLNVLRLPADPDLLRQSLSELPAEVLRTLAKAHTQGMVFELSAVHLSIERWESALQGAFLAEALAREVEARTAVPAKSDAAFRASPMRIRSLILLATSGVSLVHDSRLQELIKFRGTEEAALADADPVHQILAVIDRSEEPEESARLAVQLLHVLPERLAELVRAAEEACQRMMKVIGIDTELESTWSERIAQDERVATLSKLFEQMPEAAGDLNLYVRHQLASRLLFRSQPGLLLRREDDAYYLESSADVRVLADSQQSVIARACREGTPASFANHDGASIADRLVLRRLHVEEAIVFPLSAVSAEDQPCVGALVFPLDDDPEPEYLIRAYARLLARVVGESRKQTILSRVAPA